MFYRYDQDRGDRFDGNRISNAQYDQYKRGWQYDPIAGITLTVLIEAESVKAANARAREIGINFDPEDIAVWGFGEWAKRTGTASPMLHRWTEVPEDAEGFEEEAEALGDSDEYVLFNPWEVDPDFVWWPVFVHRASGLVDGWSAHVVWREEFDKRPIE